MQPIWSYSQKIFKIAAPWFAHRLQRNGDNLPRKSGTGKALAEAQENANTCLTRLAANDVHLAIWLRRGNFF
jgi:hypothetical protein